MHSKWNRIMMKNVGQQSNLKSSWKTQSTFPNTKCLIYSNFKRRIVCIRFFIGNVTTFHLQQVETDVVNCWLAVNHKALIT